jgi:acyl-CoA dehydrogenase
MPGNSDMIGLIESLAVIIAISLMMARRASRYLWVAVIGVFLLIWSIAHTPPAWLLTLAWAVFLPTATLLTVSSLRQGLVIKPLLALYRNIMPGMSDTEREALEAGTVWWEAEIFSGRPDWHHMLACHAPALSPEERAFLDGPTEQFCSMVNDWEITEERHDLTPECWEFLKQNGFFGMIIPKRYGGLAFSANAHSAVVMKIASPPCRTPVWYADRRLKARMTCWVSASTGRSVTSRSARLPPCLDWPFSYMIRIT